MPFQANPNAGAMDPGLLRLVFEQRENRARLQMEQQKAQMEAMRQAKQDEREDAKFQLDMALANQKLLQERANTAGTIQTLVGSVGERAQAVDPGQREAAQNSQFFGSVGDGDQQLGQDFAAAVLPNDPNAFNDELALASTLTGDRMLDQDVDMAAQMRGVSRSDVLGGAQTQLNVGAIAEQKKLDKEMAKEGRQEDKERRLAQEAGARTTARALTLASRNHALSVGLPVERMESRRREMVRLAGIAGDPNADPTERLIASQTHTDLVNQIEQEELENVPGEALADRKARVREIREYNSMFRVHRVRKAMLTRAEAGDLTGLGVQAQLKWWTANVVGLVEDATGMPFVSYYAETVKDEINKAMAAGDVEYADRLRAEMLDDATLERIAAGQISDNDATWMALTTNNPSGRTSNLMYEEMRKVNETIGATISTALSVSKLKATTRSTARALFDKRNEIGEGWPGRFRFDDRTGAWIPPSRFEAADDALVDDPMNAPVEAAVRRHSPDRLNPTSIQSLIDFNRKKKEAQQSAP
jgi:hypothetical protein